LNIQEYKWYAVTTFLQAIEIILIMAFGYTILAAVAGGLSSAIVVIMLAAYFHRRYFQKEKEDEKNKLDDNLNLIADPAV